MSTITHYIRRIWLAWFSKSELIGLVGYFKSTEETVKAIPKSHLYHFLGIPTRSPMPGVLIGKDLYFLANIPKEKINNNGFFLVYKKGDNYTSI